MSVFNLDRFFKRPPYFPAKILVRGTKISGTKFPVTVHHPQQNLASHVKVGLDSVPIPEFAVYHDPFSIRFLIRSVF